MLCYNGEQSVDYFLSLLNEKKYFIFHDLRLQVNNHFFQIDTCTTETTCSTQRKYFRTFQYY
ncbi:MAG: nuclease-related domain-containing protein [Heyndrickxia sp.]